MRLYPVYRDATPLGTVLTRRVKGAFGAIELVLAVGADEHIRGLRLQRLREPDSAAAALQNPEWLGAFNNRSADSVWQLGRDIPDVPADARVSAEAVVAGVRSMVILLNTANRERLPNAAPQHH